MREGRKGGKQVSMKIKMDSLGQMAQVKEETGEWEGVRERRGGRRSKRRMV